MKNLVREKTKNSLFLKTILVACEKSHLKFLGTIDFSRVFFEAQNFSSNFEIFHSIETHHFRILLAGFLPSKTKPASFHNQLAPKGPTGFLSRSHSNINVESHWLIKSQVCSFPRNSDR